MFSEEIFIHGKCFVCSKVLYHLHSQLSNKKTKLRALLVLSHRLTSQYELLNICTQYFLHHGPDVEQLTSIPTAAG